MSRIIFSVLTVLVYALGAKAAEGDVDARFAEMQARIEQLEAKLAAQGEELTAAKQAAAPAASATPDVAAEGESFFDTVDVSGFVAASYFYNFNDPDGDSLAGANTGGFAYPFHPDANSFSLDQVWLTVSRDSTEDHRAGFKADFVYGKTASLLSGSNVDGFAGNDFELYQGYVSYLVPIGEGVTVQAGKFATLIGAEVAQSRDNWNITRGHVYNLFQPITHTGVLASTALGPVTATFGVVDETRSFPATNADQNDNKALLWSVAAGNDQFSGSFAGTWGDTPEFGGTAIGSHDNETVLDLILRWTPSERFATYVNADYIKTEFPGSDLDGWGIAAAARAGITESTGLSGRFEYVSLDFGGPDFDVWGITGTVDHDLGAGLTLRGELRFDKVSDGGSPFVDDDATPRDDQFTAGIELLYGF